MKINTIAKQLVVALIASASFVSIVLAEDMMKDCVMMKDGNMMVCKDGKSMKMDKDMEMKNGTHVMKDGTVMMGDKKMMMKDGDMMDMEGKMMEKPAMSADKMKQKSE